MDASSPNQLLIHPFTDSQLSGIYSHDLEKNVHLLEDFLGETSNVQKCPLHELVLNYLRVRLSASEAQRKLVQLESQVQSQEGHIWIIKKESITEEGECQDGKVLKWTHDYETASFDTSAASGLHSTLKEQKSYIVEDFSVISYKAQIYRCKIQDYIKEVIYDRNEEIRPCINVLFDFQRRLVTDSVFLQDTRGWLNNLISVFLSLNSSINNHLFILNHLLRCPAGVGSWGGHFIQAPKPLVGDAFDEDSVFEHPYLSNILTLLSCLLRPIKGRESFLKEFKVSPGSPLQVKDNVWVVLDSEGEEDEDPAYSWSLLRESDLVVFLNQIPINSIYEYILRIQELDGEPVYDPKLSSEYSFLKLFAFSTYFVYLLRDGLATFNTPRYRQFAKRLGRLIRQTVQYVSDHWGGFKKERGYALDPSMFERFQIEYDNFFLRATKCIFSSQKLGAWQYLALIPYGTISQSMLWRIFYILHLDYREDDEHLRNFAQEITDWNDVFTTPDFVIQFEEKFIESLENDEGFYLLTTFANMAISRDSDKDRDFIERTSLDLFHVGFVNEETSNLCSKNVRNLLSNISEKHPFVMSILVKKLNFPGILDTLGDKSYYLIKELPLHLWSPNEKDFRLIQDWVTFSPLRSYQSTLGRLILGKLNWSDEGGSIGFELHQRTAATVMDVSMKFAPNSISDGFFEGSIKQVSNLVSRQSPEQLFTLWAWDILSKLRLHAMDRGATDDISSAMDLSSDSRLQSVREGIESKNPLAYYVALQGTQLGHSVPEICFKGFQQLKFLVDAGRFEHFCECFLNASYMFLPCPSSFACDELHSIMTALIAADQSYFKMAKDLIITDFPGPIMKEFSSMIIKQITVNESLGFESNALVLNLWIDPFTRLLKESRDRNVLYIMDIFCREIFFNIDMKGEFKHHLEDTYMNKTNCSSWLSFWKSSSISGYEVLIPSHASEFPWYAYFILQSEEEFYRPIWKSLLDGLTHEETSLDSVLSKICAEKERQCALGHLPIYKWCKQMMETPLEHPLFPLFAQKFLSYFLARPVPDEDGNEFSGVGPRFFEGIINSIYFNSVKAKIHNFAEFVLETKTGDPFYAQNEDLFCAFHLWISDPMVLQNNVHVPSLPPTYSPNKLAQLIMGMDGFWPEMIHLDKVKAARNELLNEWDKKHGHSATLNESSSIKVIREDDLSFNERIIKRLSSYEKQLPSPLVDMSDRRITRLHLAENLNGLIDESIDAILDFSNSFYFNEMEFTSLNCSYMELLPYLYKETESEVIRKVACPGTLGPKKEKFDCSGTAPIFLKFSEFKKVDLMDHKISTNRDSFRALIQRMVHKLPDNLMTNLTFLDVLVSDLLEHYSRPPSLHGHLDIKKIAIHLFYRLSDMLVESVASCSLVRHWLSNSLELLGRTFVSGNKEEVLRLLDRIISQPLLSEFLTPSFTPNVAEVDVFAQAYKFINVIPADKSMLSFVLLSKMSLEDWCGRSSVHQRNDLLTVLYKALEKTGFEPSNERQMIHGLHRNHLTIIALWEFPNHFGEAVQLLLELTKIQRLDPILWLDLAKVFLKKSSDARLDPGDPIDKWAPVMIDFAQNQTFLRQAHILHFQRILSSHFHKERMEVGLHGLYTKYKNYAKVFALLFDLTGHALVGTYMRSPSEINNVGLKKLWSEIMELFHPWLIPLIGEDKKETASWIQQMADKEQVFLPWAPGDTKLARIVVGAFSHIMNYMITHADVSQPAPIALLWSEFYFKKFTHTSVKDYVLSVIHHGLSPLDWGSFRPSLGDIEMMVKIIDTFLPPCHVFLGNIFVQISWTQVLNDINADYNPSTLQKFISSLVKLIVKLAAEPQVRQMGSLLTLTEELEYFPWRKIDEGSFESLMQWYVMSADCMTVITHDKRHPLDAVVLRLLKSAALVDSDDASFKSNKKRRTLVKCLFRLLVNCGSKRKNFLFAQRAQLKTDLNDIFEHDIYQGVVSTIPRENQLEEFGPLIKDYLNLLNASQSSPLPACVLEVLVSWINAHKSRRPVIISLLTQLSPTVISWPLGFSTAAEALLDAYFYSDDEEEGDSLASPPEWSFVLQSLTFLPSKAKEILDSAVKMGQLLVLVTYVRSKRGLAKTIREEEVMLTSILDWFRHIQLSEDNEPKLPLLYTECLDLCHRQLLYGDSESKVVGFLLQFLEALAPLTSESSTVGNILGAIGLSSQYKLTPRARFLALSLMLFLYAQITTDGRIRKNHEVSEGEDESDGNGKERAEVTNTRIQLYALKQNKAYIGLSESIDWVLNNTAEKANTIEATRDFIACLVVDKLYVESYLKD